MDFLLDLSHLFWIPEGFSRRKLRGRGCKKTLQDYETHFLESRLVKAFFWGTGGQFRGSFYKTSNRQHNPPFSLFAPFLPFFSLLLRFLSKRFSITFFQTSSSFSFFSLPFNLCLLFALPISTFHCVELKNLF